MEALQAARNSPSSQIDLIIIIMEEKSLFQPPTEDERKCPSTHWETKRSIKPFYTGGALALHPMRTSHLISLCNGALQQCDLDSGEVTLYVEKVRKFTS